MPRRPTGSVQFRDGAWKVRCTLPNGTRPWSPITAEVCGGVLPGPDDEALARKGARRIVAQSRRANYGKPARQRVPAGAETVAAWFTRWLGARDARGLSSVATDRGRISKHVEPIIGEVAMVAVTRADVERVVEHLDGEVRAGRLSWKTAANVWVLLARAFRDAAASKDRKLRVRDDNPASGVEGPDRGHRRAKGYLWPSEFLQLVACPDVPRETRRLYAVAVYTFARAGELEALSWDDVDLDHGTVHLHQSVDRERGTRKSTKGGTARRFTIEPNLVPLLRAMHREAGGAGAVLPGLPDPSRHLALHLRAHLQAAGVKRADLHTRDRTRVPLSFHDLRATGITWQAVRQDPPLQIQARAGHASFDTTQLYVREAEVIRDGFGEVFPPLPADLLDGAGAGPQDGGESSRRIVPPASDAHERPVSSARDAALRRARYPQQEHGSAVEQAVSVSDPGTLSHGPTPTNPDAHDGGTIPGRNGDGDPRAAAVATLAQSIASLTAAGDIDAARTLTEALARLLRPAAGDTGGKVLDLASERERRER